MKPWFVSILRCAGDTLYTGITTDAARRVREHNAGEPRGARYTFSRRPVTLAYVEEAASRSAASQREVEIKKLDRKPILWYFAYPDAPSVRRILVETVVRSDVGPLRIMTTHREYYAQSQRDAQIDAIRRLHAETCAHSRTAQVRGQGGPFEVFPRPAAALLCGDMNFSAAAPERSRVLAPFADGTLAFLDSWSVPHPGEDNAPTVGIHPVDFVGQPACFDFVFVTENLASHLKARGIDAETEASGHQPVWVEPHPHAS
jgi:predicted GIY-YIG superfamily endonuclease